MKMPQLCRLVLAMMLLLELISLRNGRKESAGSADSNRSLLQIWRMSSRLVVGAVQPPTIYQTDCPIKLFSRDTADNQEETAAEAAAGTAAGENTESGLPDSGLRRRRRRNTRWLISENQQQLPQPSSQVPNYISEIGVPEPNTGQSTSYYQCPGTDYPDDYQLCCPDVNECCPLPSRNTNLLNLYYLDERQLTIVTVIVVSLICFLVIATLSICCFWSICPLYNSCRIRYYRDDAGCADKMGELGEVNITVMPGEGDSPIANTLIIAKPFQPDLIESEHLVNSINAQNLQSSVRDGAREVAV